MLHPKVTYDSPPTHQQLASELRPGVRANIGLKDGTKLKVTVRRLTDTQVVGIRGTDVEYIEFDDIQTVDVTSTEGERQAASQVAKDTGKIGGLVLGIAAVSFVLLLMLFGPVGG